MVERPTRRETSRQIVYLSQQSSLSLDYRHFAPISSLWEESEEAAVVVPISDAWVRDDAEAAAAVVVCKVR